MQNITTRSAESWDLAAISRVIESAVMNWPLPARLKARAVPTLTYNASDLAHYDLVVALWNSEVVGVAALDATPGLQSGEGGLLHGLYVLPILQRQGIGRCLMEAVFRRAREQNLPGLLVKAQRVSRGYFEHQALESVAANSGEYPWQYWKRLA